MLFPESLLVKSDDKKKIDEDDYNNNGGNDTISLAQSILDSANKVLLSIGSLPYYDGWSKKL